MNIILVWNVEGKQIVIYDVQSQSDLSDYKNNSDKETL